jgi:hypothetical protein
MSNRIAMNQSDEKQTARRDAGRMAVGAITAVPLVLLVFWLQYGVVNAFAWGVAGFIAAICLLTAVGLYFQPLEQYHTPVLPRGDWGDRIGAFWLVSCFIGAAVSPFLPGERSLTVDSWRPLYALWTALAIGLPLITAAPLFRYLRGRAILIGLPLLLIITLIPVWLAAGAASDLLHGPVERLIPGTDQWELYLQYTDVSLGLIE